MKLWITILLLIPTLAFSQSYKDGLVVIQFSADFVKANEIDISKLEGADMLRLYYTQHPKIFQKENIKYLPTVILFHNGKTILRVESGISLKLPENTLDRVQEHINKIIKRKF
tara:strand:+ start:516 stop:854 length:339 start_codon:yes stop_codon:yes gene_type:complete